MGKDNGNPSSQVSGRSYVAPRGPPGINKNSSLWQDSAFGGPTKGKKEKWDLNKPVEVSG